MTTLLQRRLRKLATDLGTYCLVALDHGLTHGNYVGKLNVPSLLSASRAAGASGVVLNPGDVSHFDGGPALGLVLQTFSSPIAGDDFPKRRISSPRHALVTWGPDAIAVECNLGHPRLDEVFQEIASAFGEARRIQIPTLAMVGLRNDLEPVDAFCNGISTASALGADLIKVNLPMSCAHDSASRERVRDLLKVSPPVLLAGGPSDPSQFWDMVEASRLVGFSGFCVGRNVFESDNPEATTSRLVQAFDPSG